MYIHLYMYRLIFFVNYIYIYIYVTPLSNPPIATLEKSNFSIFPSMASESQLIENRQPDWGCRMRRECWQERESWDDFNVGLSPNIYENECENQKIH